MDGCLQEHLHIVEGVPIYTVDLAKYLQCIFREAPHLETFMEHELMQAQIGHCGVCGVLYADEAVPGNVLNPDLARKSWLIHFGFLPLAKFRNDKLWLPLACVRHNVAEKFPGKVAQLISFTLQCALPFFSGHVFGSTLVRVNRIILLADEDALKQACSAKGSSGLKPCIKCANCLAKSHEVEGYHTIAESKFASFRQYDNQEVDQIFQHLANLNARAARTKLEEDEKLSGWKHNDYVWTTNAELRSLLRISDIHYDCMHNYWSNGICGFEISLLFHAITQKAGVARSDLVEFLGLGWRKSNEIGGASNKSQLQSLVKDKLLKVRCSKSFFLFFFLTFCLSFTCACMQVSCDYRGDASQTMMLMPLLNFFLTGLSGVLEVEKEIASVQALCCVCNHILAGKQTPQSIAGLEELQEEHMQRFKQAYDSNIIRPKFHYALHTQKQPEEANCLLDCFSAERKNKTFKAGLAPLIKRLHKFEQSVLLRWLERDIAGFKDTFFDVALVKPRNESGLDYARSVRHAAGEIKESNVLLFSDGAACYVKGCVQNPADKAVYLLAQPLTLRKAFIIVGASGTWKAEWYRFH